MRPGSARGDRAGSMASGTTAPVRDRLTEEAAPRRGWMVLGPCSLGVWGLLPLRCHYDGGSGALEGVRGFSAILEERPWVAVRRAASDAVFAGLQGLCSTTRARRWAALSRLNTGATRHRSDAGSRRIDGSAQPLVRSSGVRSSSPSAVCGSTRRPGPRRQDRGAPRHLDRATLTGLVRV